MKHLFLYLLFLFAPFIVHCQKVVYDMAYQNGDKVFVVKHSTKTKLSFSNAEKPSLSPNGLLMAVNRTQKDDAVKRYISVIDLNTKKEFKIKTDSSRAFNAVWSPDNQHIAFNTYLNGEFTIGIIQSNNTGFKALSYNIENDYCSPSWSSDGKYIITHNWDWIYKFDLNLNPIDSMSMFHLTDEILSLSSDTRLVFTSDGKYIVFNCTANDEMDNVKGPIDGIFAYNTHSKEIKRVSPKGIYAAQPFLETDTTIIYSAFTEKGYNIYRSNLNSRKQALIRENGENPSVRLY